MRLTKSTSKKTGPAGVMITAAWMLLLVILTVYFSGWLEKRDNPNQLVAGGTSQDGVHEVNLKQNRSGHYVASGTINGATVRFLLDTGATNVSVPGRLAKRLSLKVGHAERVETANGTITTYFTRLDNVDLGTIRLRGVRAHINPHMNGDEVLLGMSFLRHLELVQRDGSLTLRQYPKQ